MSSSTSDTSSNPPAPSTSPDSVNLNFKPAKLFFAGTGFVVLSILTTRRALTTRRLATTPHYYQYSPSLTLNPYIRQPLSSHVQRQPQVSGAVEALQALQLATLNVVSFAMMAFGGAAWWFDIKSLDDLRTKIRKEIGSDGVRDEDSERQIEEWVASVLGRKEEREKKSNSAENEKPQ